MANRFDHKTLLQNVGSSPGIYQMLDADGRILYVGKAKNLKKRLASYFRSTGLPIKTAAMMEQVADVRVNLTHTENDALILESNLIKQHKPRYNILLRDSKSYPFIHIDDSQDYPRLNFYRGNRSLPGRYFGPYPGVSAIRQTLSLLQKVLPVRQCDDVFFNNRSRPCLQYQIKRCSAPCVGLISKEEYRKDIDMAALFLEGKDQSLNRCLQDNMQAAAKSLNYEQAAAWRDRIEALQRVQSHQSVTRGHSDIDIITVARRSGYCCVEVSFVRGGRLTGSDGHYPSNELDLDAKHILSAFAKQYYVQRTPPDEIILGERLPQKIELQEWIAHNYSKRTQISDSVRGYRRDWLQQAQENVEQRLQRRLSKGQEVEQKLRALEEALDTEDTIQRIECFDISHTQGDQTVASCVVLSTTGLVKSEYRRYNINGITPGDDYAAMRQVIERRYKKRIKEDAVLPDMILIDGGKGQLSSAAAVLNELQLGQLLLVGVAKGEGRKPGLETLFMLAPRRRISLHSHSAALHLIQLIRDEAHRFAITGHRTRRGKQQLKSVLEEIGGIGTKRKKALLTHFGGLQGIQRAGIKDIAQVKGISRDLAEKVYRHMQQ